MQSYDQLGRGAIVPASATEYEDGRPYGVQGQTPGFSPSGDALALVEHGAPSDGWDGVLVLQEDGSTIEVSGLGQPAGWLDDDRLVGRTVMEESVAQAQQGGSGIDLVGYALPSGRPVGLDGRPVTAPQPLTLDGESDLVKTQRCWRDATALAGTDGDVTAVVPAGLPGAPLVVVDPSAHVTQVIWAQDAIDGSPSLSPFGTWTFLPLWWWKEIALAALAVAGLRWWLVRRRRRRTRRPGDNRAGWR